MNPLSRPRVLIVCTANAIRSPFVEHLLRARLADAGVVAPVISSAGTAARPERAAVPEAVDLGREYGLDLAPHRTRRLDEMLLRQSTTVLCAAAVHRRAVLDMRPDDLDTTFTVREFARLLREEPGVSVAGDWETLVSRLARGRTRARPVSADDDDIVDPIGRSATVWREFERTTVDAVQTIAGHAARVLAEATAGREAGPPPVTRRQLRSRRAADPGMPPG